MNCLNTLSGPRGLASAARYQTWYHALLRNQRAASSFVAATGRPETQPKERHRLRTNPKKPTSHPSTRKEAAEASKLNHGPLPLNPTLPHRLRIPPHFDPYNTSTHLATFLQNPQKALFGQLGKKDKGPKPPVRDGLDIDIALEMLKTAPKASVSVVNWNQLLSVCGKQRKYNRMFEIYNDMKKRGIKPSLRTFIIMLSYYPHRSDAASMSKVTSRATLIYDSAQAQVQSLLAPSAPEELGYGDEGGQVAQKPDPTVKDEDQVTAKRFELVAITNAYLEQMARLGQYAEVKRVYDRMPEAGPLSPDKITFTNLFYSFREAALAHKKDPETNDISHLPSPMAVWERMQKVTSSATDKTDFRSQLDRQTVLAALQAFVVGSKEEQAFGLSLIPELFGLSLPGRSRDNKSESFMPVDERVAETVLKYCLSLEDYHLAHHYAVQFLERPELVSRFTVNHYDAILCSMARLKHTGVAVDLIMSHQPCDQPRWPYKLYFWPLRSAQAEGDWQKFLAVFRMITALPLGVEQGKGYSSQIPERVDTFPTTYKPDPRMLAMMLEAAQSSRSIANMRQALRVVGFDRWTGRESEILRSKEDEKRHAYWLARQSALLTELVQAVLSAPERAQSGRKPEEEEKWRKMAKWSTTVGQKLDKVQVQTPARQFTRQGAK